MKIALFLLSLLPLQTPAPDISTYSNPKLGLMFSYPKNWALLTNKKGETAGVMPIEGSTQAAHIEIYAIAYDKEKSVWQVGQDTINKTMKHDVVRQWEEEILGVPLLLTKMAYNNKTGSNVLLPGL